MENFFAGIVLFTSLSAFANDQVTQLKVSKGANTVTTITLTLETKGSEVVPELNTVLVKNFRIIPSQPFAGKSIFRIAAEEKSFKEVCSFLGYGEVITWESRNVSDAAEGVLYLENGKLSTIGSNVKSSYVLINVMCTLKN